MKRFSKKTTTTAPRRRTSMAGTPDERRRAGEASEDDRERRYTFRRNQTLTGSKSASVASAGADASAQLKSSRVQIHDLAQYRRNIGIVLSMSLLAVAILTILVTQLTATVLVQTTKPLAFDKARYSTHIDDYLRSHPAERLRFLLNETRLATYLHSVVPEVESVRTDGMANIGESRFVVKFRTPIVGWSIGGSEQYVDAQGIAFTKNYFDAPVVRVVDESGIRVAAGQAVASDRFLSFIGRMTGAVGSTGYTVERIVIPQATTRQVELTLKGVRYPVKVSVDRSVGEQAEDIARSVRWFTSKEQSPEYLDVRISRRAFYR